MKKALYVISEYLLLFGLAAFIGWVYEIVCVYVLYGEYGMVSVVKLSSPPVPYRTPCWAKAQLFLAKKRQI